MTSDLRNRMESAARLAPLPADASFERLRSRRERKARRGRLAAATFSLILAAGAIGGAMLAFRAGTGTAIAPRHAAAGPSVDLSVGPDQYAYEKVVDLSYGPEGDGAHWPLYVERQTGRAPLREAFAQSARAASMRSQNLDRAVGVHAIGTAAVRDVLFFFRELTQSSLEIADRHRGSARDVAGGILVRRPGIQHDDFVRSRAFQELVHFDQISIGTIAEMLPDETLQIGELMFGDGSDGSGQVEDCRIR